MPRAPKSKNDTSEPEGQPPADATAEAVQEAFDEAHTKGFIGTVPDPEPNSAYSLESGPDSPTAVPDATTRIAVPEPPKEP